MVITGVLAAEETNPDFISGISLSYAAAGASLNNSDIVKTENTIKHKSGKTLSCILNSFTNFIKYLNKSSQHLTD